MPEEFQHFHFTEEKLATCLNCPKIIEDGFHPDIRCCTYHPRIPNFLLGLALENKDMVPIIDQTIAEDFGTPEGMQQSSLQAIESLQQHAQNAFGRNEKVVCRFLDRESKLCKIYLYRHSVCSTFFCKYDLGKTGEEFWEKLQTLVSQIETALAQWCMESVGFSVLEYFKRFDELSSDIQSVSNQVSKSWSKSALKILWGDWYGKEQEFYLKCAQKIKEHQDELYEIACTIKIQQPLKYEMTLRNLFSDSLKKEQDETAPIGGTPVPVEDLWYLVQVAQKNLKSEL